MAVNIGYPKYNIQIKVYESGADNSTTKTIPNVNVAMGGSSAGYSPQQIFNFAETTASLMGGIINTSYPPTLAANYLISEEGD